METREITWKIDDEEVTLDKVYKFMPPTAFEYIDMLDNLRLGFRRLLRPITVVCLKEVEEDWRTKWKISIIQDKEKGFENKPKSYFSTLSIFSNDGFVAWSKDAHETDVPRVQFADRLELPTKSKMKSILKYLFSFEE